MTRRATLYGVVAVFAMVVTIPWACKGGDQQRRKDERADQIDQREAAADVGDTTGEVETDDTGGMETSVAGDGADVGDAGPMDRDGEADAMDTRRAEAMDAGGADGTDETDETDESPGGFEGDPSETSLGGPGDQSGGGRPGGGTDAQTDTADAGDDGGLGWDGGRPDATERDTVAAAVAPAPAGMETELDAGTEQDTRDVGADTRGARDAADGEMAVDVEMAADAEMAADGGDVDGGDVDGGDVDGGDTDAGEPDTALEGIEYDVGEPDTAGTIDYEVEPVDTDVP
ncbi:MAG: hypothetical protein ABEN55_00705 [Bradymonadaceae bacterium]